MSFIQDFRSKKKIALTQFVSVKSSIEERSFGDSQIGVNDPNVLREIKLAPGGEGAFATFVRLLLVNAQVTF